MKKLFATFLIGFIVTASFAQTLSVQGDASIAVKPTETTINLSVESKSATYPGAVQDMIKRVDRLSKDLKKLGFKDADIITSNFNVNQDRIYIKNMWKDSGFVATQNLMVSFAQDKEKLLNVLNAATKSSAKPAIRLSFGLDAKRKNEVKNELIKLAVEDAKSKADIIAMASGYKITGIKEIQYGQSSSGPQPLHEVANYAAFSKVADVEISNFEAADLKYNESISIVYSIEK